MQKPNLTKAKKRTNEQSMIIDCFNREIEKIGQNKTYFIKTYGCQMNEHDTEKMQAILENLGFSEAKIMEEANLILLNTCSIRENANNKVFGMVGRLKKIKEANPNVILGLCGCMAQEEVVVEKILNTYPWLDLVFGTHNFSDLPKLLKTQMLNKEMLVEVYSKEGEIYEGLPVKRKYQHKAWVNIMYGCDKFCTYCIVPYTRGKQRSRLKKDILNEVNDLKNKGVLEITLLGQNVNAYGKDLKDDYAFIDLLTDIAKTNIPRIRFMTSHPWDFDENMIDVFKKYSNLTPHIHLPIQSGSDRILKLMGRNYTKEAYINLYQKLKTIPNMHISTDIIVGFPGESDLDFQETLAVVEKCQFDYAFTFIFSKRTGTPAAKMRDDVLFKTKQERLQTLNRAIEKYCLKSNQKFLNQIIPVLIDDVSEKDKQVLTGYSNTMKRVNLKGDKKLIGQIVPVKITEVKTWSLFGEVVERN